MAGYIKIKEKVKKYFDILKITYQQLKSLNLPSCRVEEIDVTSRKVIIYSHGTRGIIKLSLIEVIGDPSIIANLPPIQASWLGYYYGKLYREALTEKKHVFDTHKNFNFVLSRATGLYNIISLDRDKNVTYIHIKTKKVLIDTPMNIFQNEQILSDFDPSQACYIGMLVGMMVAKKDNSLLPNHKKPILKLVK